MTRVTIPEAAAPPRLPEAVRARLETQLDALPLILDGVPMEVLDARPASGEWSAREHLAHLARHHCVFLDRTRRILEDDRPALGRYLAERDPEWPVWSSLPLDEIVRRLRTSRAELIGLAASLSAQQLARTGVHPGLGELDVVRWLNFFLLHEAHHLYSATVAIAQARGRERPRDVLDAREGLA